MRNSFILLFLIPLLSIAQLPTPNSKLNYQISLLQYDADLTNAALSICVRDVKKDSVLAEYNSNLSLVPASVYKILTTSTALALLGWDFKYETKLEYDGTLDTTTGILHGNLYIQGSGDPTLASETIIKKNDTSLTDRWAKIIYAKGIRTIEGSIIGDARVFEDEMVSYTWAWGDIGNYYGAGSSGLNFMDNKFALHFKTSHHAGGRTSIKKISPEIPGLKIINQTFAVGYADNAYIYGKPYSLIRYVKGTLPIDKNDYTIEGSQPDPPLLCAQSLDQSLKKYGVVIKGKPDILRNFIPAANICDALSSDSLTETTNQTSGKEKRKTLYTHYSNTLDTIVTETNIHSNNLFAETLLKTIAWHKNKFGDDQSGIDIIMKYLKDKGIDTKGLYMTDGCGLSRFNAINTSQLSEILRSITLDTALFNKFYPTLPIAGKCGSLRSMCKGTPAENNLHAKSGYMTRVRSYAGYVTNKSGRLLCFAVIVNNYDCSASAMRKKLEKLMVAIAETE